MSKLDLALDHVTSGSRRWAAWSVHCFTAFGAVAGLLALIATASHAWRQAFAWMAVTICIDSVDGALARTAKVKERLPRFDGALLDNMVDYFTYVIVPAFFLFESDVLPHGLGLPAAVAITLASAYQFCQADAKTDDHYFKGFPSYWNVVAFYLFLLLWPKWLNLAVVVVLAVSVVIPVKYLYPSRTLIMRPLTLTLTAVWGGLLLLALVFYPRGHELVYLSLVYVAYYFGASIYLSVRR